MKKDSLVISEKFYSIQGEGQTMGVPAIFIRLAGCNLLCKSAEWVCDSIEVWQKGTPFLFESVLTEVEVLKLRSGVHLIFTGGEPMLYQDKIVSYIDWFFEKYTFYPTIEIETNGTIIPNAGMIVAVDYWNCSPKLKNSGEKVERRLKPEAIRAINNLTQSIFKFVISKPSDFEQIMNEYGSLINRKKIVLMPAGETQEKLVDTRKIVTSICTREVLRYSDRLHIVIWNQKTGV